MYQSKLVKTFNPYNSLKLEQESIAEELDFKIIDYNTICTNAKLGKRKVYSKDELDLFYSDDFFLESYNNIIQEFLIEIYPKHREKLFYFSLKSDSNLFYLKANLNCVKNLNYYPELKNEIWQELFKIMAKYKILIIRLDRNLSNNIDNIVEAIKQGIKDEKYEFIVANGVEVKQGKIDEIKFHRQLENKPDDQSSYDEKNYCKPIQKDELLFEYVYKINGKDGKNLKGKIISPQEINFLKNPFKLKDESIYQIKFVGGKIKCNHRKIK